LKREKENPKLQKTRKSKASPGILQWKRANNKKRGNSVRSVNRLGREGGPKLKKGSIIRKKSWRTWFVVGTLGQ